MNFVISGPDFVFLFCGILKYSANEELGLFGFSATLTNGWVGSMTDSWVYLKSRLFLISLGASLVVEKVMCKSR